MGTSIRLLRLERSIQAHVSRILLQKAVFPPGAMVTVTRVELTRDLREGWVHLSYWGPAELNQKSFSEVERVWSSVQQMVARELTTKNTPRLRWTQDTGWERAEKLNATLAEIKEQQN